MRILRKLIAIAILAIFCFNITGVSAASTDMQRASKNIILTKVELKKIRNGDKYIKQLDLVTKKFAGNEEKLREFSKNISNAKYKLAYSKSWKSKRILAILNYLEAKVNYELKKIAAQADEKLEKTLEEVKNPSISSSDKKKVEAEIVKIQSNLFENWVKNFWTLTKEFEKLTNYENKGDIKMNLNIDQEQIWKVKAELKLNNYTAKNSNFDSQLKGHLSAMLDAAPKNQEAVKLEFSNFLDFIQKDWNMYILMNDLKIVSEENVDNLKEMIETAKKIAEENEYIEFSDKQTQEAMRILESFAPEKIIADGRTYFSKPMFTAYKKEENKYYLVPSKYACDTMKEVMNKFDPIHGKTCSTNQYNDLVREMLGAGNLTLELWNTNTLAFSVDTVRHTDIDKLDITLKFNDSSVEAFNMIVLPNQKQLKGEKLTIDYTKNNSLNAYFYANKGAINYSLKSTLDRNNKFSEITYTWNSTTRYQDIISTFTLNNGTFDGKFDVLTKNFNKAASKYREEFKAQLNGNLDNKNDLKDFTFTYYQNDLQKNKKDLEGTISYKNKTVTVKNKYTGYKTNADLSFVGKWDTYNKNFKDFDFNLKVSEDEKYDLVVSDISLKNGKISGLTVVSSEKQYLVKIKTDGSYEKDSITLKNAIDIQPEIMKALDPETMQVSVRDSSRFWDLYEIQDEIKAFADENDWVFPTSKQLQEKSEFLPQDPKGWKEINECKFGYTYQVNKDLSVYKLTACREKESYDGKMKMTLGNFKQYNPVTYKFEEKEVTGEVIYIHNYNNWEKVSEESKWLKSATANYNISIDSKWTKDNSNIYFDFKFNDKTIVDFELDVKSNTEYKDVEIEAPKSSKSYDEIIK